MELGDERHIYVTLACVEFHKLDLPQYPMTPLDISDMKLYCGQVCGADSTERLVQDVYHGLKCVGMRMEAV